MRRLLPIDELNILAEYLGKNIGRLQKEEVEDSVLDILILSYVYGNQDANDMIESNVDVNDEEMLKAIYKKVADKTFYDRVSDYFDAEDVESIIRVADTEMTRLYNESEIYVGTNSGKTIYKKWNATLDNKTRDTHWILNGTIVKLEDKFYSVSGDSAYAPGGFETPEENCNCRCVLDLIAQ